MKTFKTGTAVRFVQPVIQGVIVGGRLAESGDAVNYVVAYPLPNGEWVEREFNSADLETLDAEGDSAVLAKNDDYLVLRQSQSDNDEAASRLHAKQTEPAELSAEAVAAEVLIIREERRIAIETKAAAVAAETAAAVGSEVVK